MDDAQFWKIIEHARADADGDPNAVGEGVQEQLTKFSPVEIVSFDTIMASKVSAAYTHKLWGAAYLLNGGCSDDGFYYFRGWLLAQGQKVYEAAVADPDTLARFADPDDDYHECEDLLYAAMHAYKTVAGEEMPMRPNESQQSLEPSGEPWDFDDAQATARYLPRLARKYDL